MPAPNHLRVLYLTHLSKPASDRALYRAIRGRAIARILHVGIGLGERALRMIEMARLHVPDEGIEYTGVDRFEDRDESDGPGLSLKAAHRMLKQTGARIHLLPGDPFAAVARAANSLARTDLVVISSRGKADWLERAWFYFPRMLHDRSLVYLEEGPEPIRAVPLDEINGWARAATRRRAA